MKEDCFRLASERNKAMKMLGNYLNGNSLNSAKSCAPFALYVLVKNRYRVSHFLLPANAHVSSLYLVLCLLWLLKSVGCHPATLVVCLSLVLYML